MLIDASYFVTQLSIPNSGDPSIARQIDYYIQKYEPEFLKKMMGFALYTAYQTGVAANEARHITLRDGGSYVDYQGMTREYVGLVQTTGTYKHSPIANYIYCQYRKANLTQFSGIAEWVPGVEGGTVVNPRKKLAGIWNEMNDWIEVYLDFVYASNNLPNGGAMVYPEFQPQTFYEVRGEFGYMNPIF